MSAPALEAGSPAPVRTTQRHVPRSSSSHNRARSVIICRDIALSLTWLSMVTITTCGPCARARIAMSVGLESRDDDDLAVRPALGQKPDRLDAFLEGKTVRDARPELAGLVPLEQLVDRPAQLVGRVPAEVAQRAAQRGAVLDQEPVRRDVLDPADEAHHQNPAAPAERRQRRVEEVAADRIETHVGALTIRQSHHPLGELLRRVVDELVGPALAGHSELLRGAGRRDDARAHRLADLDRREADAAGGTQDEQGLTGLKAGLPADRHVTRDVRDRKGARLLEAHAGRDGGRLGPGSDPRPGEAAAGANGHHPVAGLEPRDALAAGGHDA